MAPVAASSTGWIDPRAGIGGASGREGCFTEIGRPRFIGARGASLGVDLRKFAALVLAAVICVGGMVVMVLAGILSALITDPFYSFWIAFAPFGVVVALGVGDELPRTGGSNIGWASVPE